MNKTNSKKFIIVSVAFYVIAAAAMIIGTVYDLEISKTLFDPQNKLAIYFEAFGQAVYWGMWGPLFSVLFITKRSFNSDINMILSMVPFAKNTLDTESKLYKTFDFVYRWGLKIIFFVLAVVGWRKLVANVLNDFFDFEELIYYSISLVVAVIGIILLSRLDKKVLAKLETLAVAGIIMGIVFKLTEECKTITHRIRFREMVAYSNGFLDEKGMSFGKMEKLSAHLTASMKDGSDFSAFTRWYKIAEKSEIYSKADSFPSGHTTYSSTIYLSVLLSGAFSKLKKAGVFLTVFSFLYVALMALSRIIAGAHYLTDVAAGAIIGYTVFIAVRCIYLNMKEQEIL